MIDYKNLDSYYLGIIALVEINLGGAHVYYGSEQESAILYKYGPNSFAVVNHGGATACQRTEKDLLPEGASYEIFSISRPGEVTKDVIRAHTRRMQRITFNPNRY